MIQLAAPGEIMLEMLATVIDERKAVYCSAPITTGQRYFSWLQAVKQTNPGADTANESLRSRRFNEVVAPNSLHAREVITKLRHENRLVVIDPTAAPPQVHWDQAHWHAFWGEVIRRYAARVVFVDHWEYSSGCAYEFLVATQEGIPAHNERGTKLSITDAMMLLEEAVREVSASGNDAAFLAQVLEKLRELDRNVERLRG